jgi:hypothetical protein
MKWALLFANAFPLKALAKVEKCEIPRGDILQEYAHGITETKSNNLEEEYQRRKRDR